MLYKGNLEKMISENNSEVVYTLPVGDDRIDLNPFIGKNIQLTFLDQINCVACGKKTNKSFSQGFCYNCFQSSPMASECILRPDQCKAHLGVSRDMEWSKTHCLQPHIVYLAVSSNLKVGITRQSQIPTRWIDQGASAAIILATVPNRHIAGTIEKYLMQYYSDKTSWQAMLKGTSAEVDLVAEKKVAASKLPVELQQYIQKEDLLTQINFPVSAYPDKVKSDSFDKSKIVSGVLKGIKGQYLIFEDNTVLNVRKHRGYLVEVSL